MFAISSAVVIRCTNGILETIDFSFSSGFVQGFLSSFHTYGASISATMISVCYPVPKRPATSTAHSRVKALRPPCSGIGQRMLPCPVSAVFGADIDDGTLGFSLIPARHNAPIGILPGFYAGMR